MFILFFCNYDRHVLFFSVGKFVMHLELPDADMTKVAKFLWAVIDQLIPCKAVMPRGLTRKGSFTH